MWLRPEIFFAKFSLELDKTKYKTRHLNNSSLIVVKYINIILFKQFTFECSFLQDFHRINMSNIMSHYFTNHEYLNWGEKNLIKITDTNKGARVSFQHSRKNTIRKNEYMRELIARKGFTIQCVNSSLFSFRKKKK